LEAYSTDNSTDYNKKLILSNGETLPDPYISDHEWIIDMPKLPAIIWPDIYTLI